MLLATLRNLLFGSRRCRLSRSGTARRARVQLEPLEDRRLLSGADLTVMSYNLYQGSELTQILAAQSFAQVPAAVSAVWAEVQSTHIPERAAAWANQVAAAEPDVLALQEAFLWRIQTPGTTLSGHPTPATTVVYDFISSLVNDLAARGLHYQVVGTVNGLDGQLPDAAGDDIRGTDRVALLARADEPPGQLRWSNMQAADYQMNPVLHIGGANGPPFTVFNGWVSADFTKRGETFRVITTHLDSSVPAINAEQAHELLAGPANTSLPVILLGDLNSPADDSGSATHHDLIAAGFQDTWVETHPNYPGFTAQPQVDLQSPVFGATQRIDYILTRGGFDPDGMQIRGTAPTDKTPSGLWPSDHAAVVATLDLPGHHDDQDDEAGPMLRLGVLGDSHSFAGTTAGTAGDLEWPEVLEALRPGRITIFSEADQAATSSSILADGKVAAMVRLVRERAVDAVVLVVGSNDVLPNLPSILAGNPLPFVNSVVANLEDAINQIEEAGPTRLVVWNIPDIGVTPAFRQGVTSNPVLLQRVTNAIRMANARLEDFAAARAIPIYDVYSGLYAAVGSLTADGVPINQHLFSPDGFHPSTVGSAFAAEAILEALHLRYHLSIGNLRMSDEEILDLAVVPHAHRRSFLDLRPYIIVNAPDL
jgi:endonuclease/exonuclease/phosphatase family metal-dependent hydrolase/lysophospholipase L1-like esterase